LGELNQDLTSARKFTDEISKETDENKILELINGDIKKSSIFNLDEL
jgi:hypothetical protein